MSPQNPSRTAPVMMVIAGLVLIFSSIIWIAATNQAPSASAGPTAIPTSALLAQPMGGLATPAEVAIPLPDIERIALEQAKAAYDGKQAVFLDVRGDPYYQTGHIPGALSISVADLPARLGELDKNAWIITYCT